MKTKNTTDARLDRFTLGRATIDNEGILRAPAVLAVTGVHSYRRADGTIRRELVDADVLGDAESLTTLEGAPLVYLHPDDHPEGLVTSETAAKHAAGAVAGTPRLDEQGQLCARLVVHRRDVRDVVTAGTRELSCGYMAQVDHTPGTWTDPRTGEAVPYDSRQVKRTYNHVAVVPAGRHGGRARVYLDSHDGAAELVGPDDTPETEPPMTEKISTVRIDGADHQMDPALAVIVAGLVTARNDSKADAEKLQGRVDALEADLKTAKADAEKAKADGADAVTPAKLQARLDRIDSAVKAGVDRAEAVKLDDAGLMRAVVGKRYPDLDIKSRSDAAIEGMYELAVVDQRKDNLRQVSSPGFAGSPPSTQAKADGADPYEAFEQQTRNGWQSRTAN